MAERQEKKCARCGGLLQCNAGSIEQCDCSSILLSNETTEWIQQEYNDCLCLDCLKEVSDLIARTIEETGPASGCSESNF